MSLRSYPKLGSRLTVGAVMALMTLFALGCGSSGSHQGAGSLYLSPHGSDRAHCSRSSPCLSLSHAVAVAHVGEQINLAAGTYSGEVIVRKRLTIRGFHGPVLDARGHGRGIVIEGPSAAGSVVQGVVVENATYEGILALGTKRVTIADDVIRNNDRGFFVHGLVAPAQNASYERVLKPGVVRGTAAHLVRHSDPSALARRFSGECVANGQPPGPQAVDDRAGGCGEAVHLASTSDSRVVGNIVSDNIGGIYLTDESGPAAHNLVAGNRVLDNIYDCGITLASHSRRAAAADGRPEPQNGGVYDNTIRGNIADGNGVRVPGAGILVAAAFYGGAAYGNRVIGNTVNGNGLPGIALHSHNPHQDLNDNVIRDNVVGRNALGGAHGGPGDGDAGIHRTAGIVVWSWATRITRILVSGNRIAQNYYGIWTKNAPRLRAGANAFVNVRVPVSQH
jgi:parallel beta-helix repeat protein